MLLILLLFSIGLALSAFFSGSETGFYRVSRMRLVIDGVGGDRVAQGLLWASNHPEAFVATALVGNNVSNYLVSTAIVLAAGHWLPASGVTGELTLTLLLAPVVFIFGELLPKRAFLQAPYGLLRRSAPALFMAGVVLSVASALLWLASRALSVLTGASIEPLRMALKRRELADMFAEGHAVGLLSPAQKDLALSMFSLGGRPVRDFMTPIGRQSRLNAEATPADLLRLARRHSHDAWPIERSAGSYGAARASLCLTQEPSNAALPIEPMPEFRETMDFLHAITHMESHAHPLAAVRGASDRVIGFVRLERLQKALLASA